MSKRKRVTSNNNNIIENEEEPPKKKLFAFQNNSVNWMSELESKIVDEKVDLTYNLPSGFSGSFNVKGGILAHQMGLGKTIIISKLIEEKIVVDKDMIHVPYYIESYIEDQAEGLWYETNATLIICPSHLVSQWYDEILSTISIDIDIVKICTMNDCKKHTYKDIINADVVITAHNFMLNKKHIKNKRLNDKNSNDTIYNIGMKAIFGYVSFEYEENRGSSCYDKYINDYSPVLFSFKWKRVIIDEAHEVLSVPNMKKCFKFQNVLPCIKSDYNWYVSGTPFPHNHYSAYGMCYFLQGSNSIPIIDKCVLQKKKKINTEFLKIIMKVMKGNVFHRLTYRDIKKDKEVVLTKIKEKTIFIELTIDEKAIYSSELVFYNNDSVHMRKFCNHPRVIDMNTFSNEDGYVNIKNIKEEMVKNVNKRIEFSNKRILDLDNRIRDCQDQNSILEFTKEEIKDLVMSDIERLQLKMYNEEDYDLNEEHIAYIKVITDGYQSFQELFEKNNKRMKNAHVVMNMMKDDIKHCKEQLIYLDNDINEQLREGCKICYSENIFDGDVSGLECGHLFCKQCILKWFDTIKPTYVLNEPTIVLTCPVCRAKILKENVIFINEESVSRFLTEDETENSDNSEEDVKVRPPLSLINNYGSKIATLIKLINVVKMRDNTAKFIIFSQWDNLLLLMGQSLSKEGISNVLCRGSANSKVKSINSFKNGDTLAILLSLEHTASGTNLVEANHVIIMDPLSKSQEEQAVKRSHRIGQNKDVYVYRFIVKDTIEEIYYNKYR